MEGPAEEGSRLDSVHRGNTDGAGVRRLHAAETRAALKRKMEPSYMGAFHRRPAVCDAHLCQHPERADERKRVSRFMEGKPCPTCHGKRLKPEALSVTFAGVDIGALMQMPPLDQLAALLEPVAQGDSRARAAGAATDKEATRRDRAERAASGRAVHAVRTRLAAPGAIGRKAPRRAAPGRWRDVHACANCVGWAWAT